MKELNALNVTVLTGVGYEGLYWLTVYNEDKPVATLECLSEEEVLNTTLKDIIEMISQ